MISADGLRMKTMAPVTAHLNTVGISSAHRIFKMLTDASMLKEVFNVLAVTVEALYFGAYVFIGFTTMVIIITITPCRCPYPTPL